MTRRPEPDIPPTRQELAELQTQFGTTNESALQPFINQHIADASSSITLRLRDQSRDWLPLGSFYDDGSGGVKQNLIGNLDDGHILNGVEDLLDSIPEEYVVKYGEI